MKLTTVLSIVAVLVASPAFAQCYNANGVPFPCGPQMYGYHVPAAPRQAPLLVPNPSYNMGGPAFVPNNRDYDMEPGNLTGSRPHGGTQAPQPGFEQYENQ